MWMVVCLNEATPYLLELVGTANEWMKTHTIMFTMTRHFNLPTIPTVFKVLHVFIFTLRWTYFGFISSVLLPSLIHMYLVPLNSYKTFYFQDLKSLGSFSAWHPNSQSIIVLFFTSSSISVIKITFKMFVVAEKLCLCVQPHLYLHMVSIEVTRRKRSYYNSREKLANPFSVLVDDRIIVWSWNEWCKVTMHWVKCLCCLYPLAYWSPPWATSSLQTLACPKWVWWVWLPTCTRATLRKMPESSWISRLGAAVDGNWIHLGVFPNLFAINFFEATSICLCISH